MILFAQQTKKKTVIKKRLRSLYGKSEEQDGISSSGRRYIEWRFAKNVDKDLTNRAMAKIRGKVTTSFYIYHSYGYWLLNTEEENASLILFYKPTRSSFCKTFSEAEAWLREKEAERLSIDNIERPDTKWVFRGFSFVDVKVVLDRFWEQALCPIGCEILLIGDK